MGKYRECAWFALVLHFILVIYILTNFKIQDMTLVKGETYKLNENWTIIREDGTSEKITLPYYEPCEANVTIMIENTIPKEFWGKTLKFISADKTVEIYVDDECIYEFGVNDERDFGKTPGSITNCVDIPKELKSGNIRIVFNSPYANFAAEIDEMEFGEREVVLLNLLKYNMLEIGCCAIILFAGIAFLIMAVAQQSIVKTTDGLEYLSMYCMISVIYYAIETKILNIFYGNQTLYSVLVFIILMLLPLFLTAYYSRGILAGSQKGFKTLLIVEFANALIQPILQISGVCDFMDMAAISHLLMFVVIIVLLKKLYNLNRSEKKQSHWIEFTGIAVIGVCGIMDIVRSYTLKLEHLDKYSRYGTTLFCFIMLVAHIVRIIRRYSSTLKENTRLLEAEVETIEKKNEELRIAREQAIAASNAKTNFLARMSHEIRTPIGVVLGMNEMILKRSEQKEIRNFATDIDSAANALLGIINEILDLSKIESGKMTLNEDTYDISVVLHKIYNMAYVRAKQKELDVYVSVDENIHLLLYGDDGKVEQVLINLLSNAIKYTKEGSITLKVTKTSVEENRESIRFEITDTGIGIKPEDMEKLFGEYERLDEVRNKGVEGTGLGMSITKALLELMGSTLCVKSEYGKGSTFSFEITQNIMSDELIGSLRERIEKREVKEAQTLELKAEDAKILVVDDNELNRKVFKVLLEESAIKIDEASKGVECLEMVKKKKYDIIFLDHMMPEMDGVETLRQMKNLDENPNKDTMVIALTANALIGAKEFYMENGFDGYLSKPIEVSKLYEIIRNNITISEEMHENNEKGRALEGFDFEEAKTYLPTEKVRNRTLKKLVNNLPRDIEKLVKYEENIENDEEIQNLYTVTVHALKGIFKMLCNRELASYAEELEHKSKQKDIDFIKKNNSIFVEKLKECVKKIDDFFNGDDILYDEEHMMEPKRIIRDKEEIAARIKKIYEAVYSFDENIIKDEMKTLKNCVFPGKVGEMTDELMRLADDMEIGKMMEMAEELKGMELDEF